MTVNLNKTDTGTFYGPNYLKWTFAQDFWFTRNYIAAGRAGKPAELAVQRDALGRPARSRT